MGRLLCRFLPPRTWGRFSFIGCCLALLTVSAPAFARQKESVTGQEDSPAATAAENAGKPVLVIDARGHTAPVRKVLFTPDGKQIITISQDKTIRFWDVQTGRTLRVLRPPIEEGAVGELMTGALSPDGKILAVGCLIRDEETPSGTHSAIYLIALADGTMRHPERKGRRHRGPGLRAERQTPGFGQPRQGNVWQQNGVSVGRRPGDVFARIQGPHRAGHRSGLLAERTASGHGSRRRSDWSDLVGEQR